MTSNPAYQQLLQPLLMQNPELANYLELFQQLAADDAEPGESEKVRELEMRLKKISAAAKRLKADLYDTLDDLDELARAIGACEECLGKNARCPTCRGKGKAGFYQPDRALFDQWILPAVREVPWLDIKEQ